jgi:hypothetical protein
MPSIQVKDANSNTQTVQTLPAVGQTTSANSLPVVIASDQSVIAVSASALPLPAGAATAANQTSAQSAPGTSAATAMTVQGAASGVPIPVAQGLATSGGWKPKLLNGLSTSLVAIKSSAGQLAMIEGFNPNTAQVYLQVFDNASPILGTTTPVLSVPIAPGATGGFSLSQTGVQFSNAIVVAATTTATGSTAPSTAVDCNAVYN